MDTTKKQSLTVNDSKSEKKYRLLFNSLPYGGEVLDTNGKILLCSASTAKMLGYKESELIGKSITDFLSPDSTKIFHKKFSNLLQGKSESAEIRMLHKNGTELDILRSAQPILDSNGKTETILALNVNITKRKKVEEALKKSEEKYRLISDNSYDIISFWVNNKLEYISPALERITGYKVSEVKDDYSSFIHPDDIEAHIASIKYNKQNKVKSAVRIERYKFKDGKYHWLENNIRNEYKDDGTTITTVVIRDITDRKKAEEKLFFREKYLAALNKAKEVLLVSESENINAYQQFVDILGPASKASRAYIFLNHTGEKGENLISRKAEYCAPGISSHRANSDLQNLNYDDFFKRWKNKFSKGELIYGKIKDFPKREKEFLAAQDIKAVLIIPIVVDNNFIGFIGYDNCISEKEWDKTERDFLQSAAHDLAQFIIIKREKKKLLKEHKRFVTAMNSLSETVSVTDIQTHEILFANNHAKLLFGDDMVGKACWQVFRNNSTDSCDSCGISKLLDENGHARKPYNWDLFNPKTNKWYSINDQAIEWIDGRIVRLSMATDITSHKLIEEKLKQRENYLSALNKAKKVLLSTNEKPKDAYQRVVNILGSASKASRAYIFLNHTGEKGENLISRKAEYCAPGISSHRANSDLQNLNYDDFFKRWKNKFSKGELIYGKIKDFPKREKEFLAAQDIKAVLIIPIVVDNNFIGFIGYDNCISEKEWDKTERDFLQSAAHDLAQFIIIKREKKKLLKEHKRFETVMNSLDAAVYVTDIHTNEILFANNHSKQIYGNDIIGKKCWEVFHDNLTAPCQECSNDKLLDENGNPKNTYNWEFFNHHINKWLAINDRAIKWTDGRIAKLEFAVDNTDRHEATERLDKYARTQEVLLREVNHRVKNNLYAMMGMLSKEKKLYEKKNKHQQSEFIENIILRIDSLSTVHSLLSASKWQPLNLTELCRELIEHLSDSIALHKSISADITPSEITVSSNMAHNLTLIINEIITNAVKYASPAKGDLIIGVEVKSDDKNIILRIKDNGNGFPQPFLDGDFKGSGVGFELIFGIVKESLGGHVTIENDNGAVFNISVKKEDT